MRLLQKRESKLEEISAEMAKTGSDFTKAQDLMKQETELNEKLEQLMERWAYLAELAEELRKSASIWRTFLLLIGLISETYVAK